MASRRDALLYLALAAVWGTAFPATKAALADFPPVLLGGLRFTLAAVLLFAVAAATGRSLRPRGPGDWTPILVGGVFNIGAHHALLFAGQDYVTSAVASTLLGLVPVLTPAVTAVFRPDESISARGVAGVLLGFLGVVLIANPDPDNLLRDVGVWLVLASAVAWVAGAVFTREDAAALPGLSLQAWMLAVGALALDAVSLLLPGQGLAAATPTTESLLWVGYLAVIPGAFGFLVYFRLLHRLGPIEMGLIEYVIPPFAAVFGWLVLDESLAPSTVYGFAAILAGFLLVKWRHVQRYLRQRIDGTGPPSAD
ncbi:DMT family transporter [Halocalculus aciditolerans]|nr:DMT family transporter [Halocalculus aciditolerans]